MDEQAVHQALLRPQAYPDYQGAVGFTETHVSRLYFTDRHVYKLKKPVDFGFLNFTSVDRRRFYCEEELRLNRRFAPGTYLGVVEIRRTAEGIRVAEAGEILDYAVWMRRLPAEAMLDRRIEADDPALPAQMAPLGERLAELHRSSEVCRHDGGQSNLEVVRTNWRENFSQIAPHVGRSLSAPALGRLSAWVERHLAEEAALIEAREADGFVRDGHGDLHAEHICLTEPLQIYDCIEFNRRFRVADEAADIAFLLMDLEFRGRRDLAEALLAAWSAGRTDDGELAVLLPFYKVYRAFVRGKVESFLAAAPAAEAAIRQRAAQRARAYFNLALGYLCRPALVLTAGLMGT
ncbi:MAG: kinase, partial [Desulfuromonadales bacterium]|nr:kinase [Desulfuromonadales bacterium]